MLVSPDAQTRTNEAKITVLQPKKKKNQYLIVFKIDFW